MKIVALTYDKGEVKSIQDLINEAFWDVALDVDVVTSDHLLRKRLAHEPDLVVIHGSGIDWNLAMVATDCVMSGNQVLFVFTDSSPKDRYSLSKVKDCTYDAFKQHCADEIKKAMTP